MPTTVAFVVTFTIQFGLLNGKIDVAPGTPCNDILGDISVFPGSAEYNAVSEIHNIAYASDLPSFIAIPATVQDVQRCLQCSYNHSVPCVVKSGGHGNAGYSTIKSSSGGFVIYLANMKQMEWGKDTVKVQAGARWEDVYDQLDDSNLIVSGSCPSVGVAGFTLGGGISFLSRNFGGFASDNTLSFTMVTANGSSVVIANSTSHPELYFALRGGGGGNFGIVVDMTFRLHQSLPNYVYGSVTFNGGDASKEALMMVGKIIPFDKRLNLDMAISKNPSTLTLYPFYMGSYDDAIKSLKSFIEKASVVHLQNYTSYKKVYYDHSAAQQYTVIAPYPMLIKGCFLNGIPPGLVNLLFENPMPSTCIFEFQTIGGEVGTHMAHETAFFFRDAQYYVYTPCYYENNEEKEKVTKFVTNLYNALEDAGYCFGNYVNDMDRELFDWQEKYYGGNYDRLKVIQDDWNPTDKGAFHFLQEIGSLYQPRQSKSKTSRQTEL